VKDSRQVEDGRGGQHDQVGGRAIAAWAKPRADLIVDNLCLRHPLWGAPRIHGELQKLGLEISQATVSKYVVRRRTPPSQTWRTFLDNHIGSLVSVDFFTVPTVLFKVLFVFVALSHDRRRVVHVNVTDAPTAQWTAQQRT
jgi:putative transposase